MTKRQLIDEILERNSTADAGFLARFDDSELDDYLTNLRRLQTPRLTGDAGRYEKYFNFNIPARPAVHSPEEEISPCLPTEESEIDDSFWHLDQDFPADDEELRRRVDRFAEQLIDRMTSENDITEEDDDGGGSIVYHRIDPSLDDDGLEDSFEETEQQDDATLQETGVRSASHGSNVDAWLF